MPTFVQLMDNFLQLYVNGDFESTLYFLDQAAESFTDEAAIISIWRAAVLARLGQFNEALRTIHEALEAGHWYHEDSLRADPDFADLQTDSDFQALVERSAAQRIEATRSIEPTYLTMMPKGSAERMPLLIALHHSTGNAKTFADHWKVAARQGWLVLVPQSSQPSWLSGFYEWTDSDRAIDEITQLFYKLRQEYPIDPQRVVLAGFSTGADLALKLALANKFKVQGVMAVEGHVKDTFDVEEWTDRANACSNVTLRVCLLAGEGNPSFAQANRLLHDILRGASIPCNVNYMQTNTHTLPANFKELVRQSLQFITNEHNRVEVVSVSSRR
jgi:predicted esterase